MAVATKRHYLALLKYAWLCCSAESLHCFCHSGMRRSTSSEAHLSSFGIELVLRYAGSRMPSQLCCFAGRLGVWSRSQIVSYWMWNFDGRKVSGRAFIEEQCWLAAIFETHCDSSIGSLGSTSALLASSSSWLRRMRLTDDPARR